jgi:hypothetical protein
VEPLASLFLIELLLPLFDNDGQPLDRALHREVATELTERFGGLTAHTRAPAKGLWKPSLDETTQDDIVIYEVMTREVDAAWWQAYRNRLEARFRQQKLVIRAMSVDLL